MKNEKILAEEDRILADEYYEKGKDAYDAENYDEAEIWFNKFIKIDKHEYNSLTFLGCISMYKTKYSKAIELFDKSISIGNRKQEEVVIEKNIAINSLNEKVSENSSQGVDNKTCEYVSVCEKIIKMSNNMISKITESRTFNNLLKAFCYSKTGNIPKAALSFIDSKISLLQLLTEYKKCSFVIPEMLDQNADPFFNKTVSLDHKYRDAYKNIYIKSLEIVASLYINKKEEQQVAHYTRKAVAELLLAADPVSPFRLNTVATANDPKEGKPLLQFLGIAEDSIPEDYQAFVGCFIFNPDSLNQFRLYGKENGEEGTGVSVVFSKEYFNNEVNINPTLFRIEQVMDDIRPDTTTPPDPDKHALFRCIYLDPVTSEVISVGHKEEYIFYREKYKEKNKIYKKTIEEYNRYKKDIDTLINDVRGSLNDLKGEIDELFEKIKTQRSKTKIEPELREANRTLCELLIHLRYLVKHVAFKEEQECRIIRVEPLADNKEIHYEDNRMYINYIPATDYITDVYFGPKAKGMELFKDLLKYKGLNHVECHQCEHPFF